MRKSYKAHLAYLFIRAAHRMCKDARCMYIWCQRGAALHAGTNMFIIIYYKFEHAYIDA